MWYLIVVARCFCWGWIYYINQFWFHCWNVLGKINFIVHSFDFVLIKFCWKEIVASCNYHVTLLFSLPLKSSKANIVYSWLSATVTGMEIEALPDWMGISHLYILLRRKRLFLFWVHPLPKSRTRISMFIVVMPVEYFPYAKSGESCLFNQFNFKAICQCYWSCCCILCNMK